MVADDAMTGQRSAICEDHVIADAAVMADMAIGHEEAPIADLGDPAAGIGADVHGDPFANVAVGADHEPGGLTAVARRLWRPADRGERMNHGARADGRAPRDVDMGDEPAAGPDHDIGPDDAIGPD